MNNSISNADYPATKTDEVQNQGILRIAWINVSGNIVAFLLLAYFAWQINVWQLAVSTVFMVVGSVVSFVGLWLIKRGRLSLGAWLILIVPMVTIFVVGLLITNLGFFLAVIGIVVATVNAGQLMSDSKQIYWIVISSFVVALTVIIVDQFDLPFRFQAPEQLVMAVIILIGFVLLGYGYFLRREFNDYSLQTKFIVTVLAVTLISLSLLAFFYNRFNQTRLVNSANQNLLALASQTVNSLDTLIQSKLNAIDNEAQLPVFSDFLVADPSTQSDSQLRIVLTNLTRKDAPYILTYGLLNADGKNVVDSRNLNIGQDEANHDYFQIPWETGETYVSPVLFDPETELPVIYFSALVRNTLGQKLGVLRAKYQARFLQDFLETTTKDAPEGSFAVLFDENHLHLGHSIDPSTLYKLVAPITDLQKLTQMRANNRLPLEATTQSSLVFPELEEGLSNASTQPFFEARDVVTQDTLNQVAVAFSEIQPWQLAFFQPQDILFEPVRTQTRITVLLAVGISVLVAVVAVFASRQLTRPIIRLTDVAQQVAQGDLNVQAPVESKDETGQLSAMFNSMTERLRGVVGSLEEQVRERTAELALSIEVGQQAAAIRDLNELLPAITEFIRERFDLYYVHVYFVDDLGQNLVIKSGTGVVGQTLLDRRHSLPIGGESIVGQVAATRQPIVVSNTETSSIHKANPLLPYTRSELAVPLIVEGWVIGVLDMQSDRVDTFREDNLTVFEAMGTQLAISIDSAQQWALAQEAQRKSEEVVSQLTREKWTEKLQTRRQALGYVYDLANIAPVDGNTDGDTQNGGLSVPVVVQNLPIGRLSVNAPEQKAWSEDEKALVEAVVQQLAQKAENLRLFEETQQRATREQIARQITDKIRASRDIETALKTAAEELSKALNTPKAVIDLRVDQSDKVGDE